MKAWIVVAAAVTAALVLAPNAVAHARAVVVENPNTGARCYVYTNDTETPEFWLESNGVTTGGVPGGTPADHATGNTGAGSGLQRAAVGSTPADTLLTADGFLGACVL